MQPFGDGHMAIIQYVILTARPFVVESRECPLLGKKKKYGLVGFKRIYLDDAF
jgi:hypothetical protein